MIQAQPFDVVFERFNNSDDARITVLITCYKYGRESLYALNSLRAQTEPLFDIILIDDCSPDDSVEVILEWMEKYASHDRFRSVHLLKHGDNQGLSQARNTAITQTSTQYVFILDADNMIYPRCLQVLQGAIENSGAEMAYSLIECFGDETSLMGNELWQPERFAYGNYIDAMALIRVSALQTAGGYRQMPHNFGWEDYDLWCTFVDRGFRGCHVPQILCRYRVHDQSMLRTETNGFVENNMDELRKNLEKHHSFKFYFA